MTAAVTLTNVTVSYRGHPAVHHVSGAFSAGSATALLGPNGGGKSSLLAAIAGLVQKGTLRGPSAGTPREAAMEGRMEWAPGLTMAYLPQSAELDRSFPVRVSELVAMGLWSQLGSLGALRSHHQDTVSAAMDSVGLRGFARRWVNELSTGQLQRALFARVLVQNASLILLDEPFNAIDARTTADLLALLPKWRAESRTVIAVLHDVEQVKRHFDCALMIAREPIAWGPTAQVLKTEHWDRARQMAEAWDDAAALCERTDVDAEARAVIDANRGVVHAAHAHHHGHVHDHSPPHDPKH
jgi:zinc/manganese transport system ATP-binding protein